MIETLARAVLTAIIIFVLSAVLEGYFMNSPEFVASFFLWALGGIMIACAFLIYSTLGGTLHERVWDRVCSRFRK